jgi:hypothetical protein
MPSLMSQVPSCPMFLINRNPIRQKFETPSSPVPIATRTSPLLSTLSGRPPLRSDDTQSLAPSSSRHPKVFTVSAHHSLPLPTILHPSLTNHSPPFLTKFPVQNILRHSRSTRCYFLSVSSQSLVTTICAVSLSIFDSSTFVAPTSAAHLAAATT